MRPAFSSPRSTFRGAEHAWAQAKAIAQGAGVEVVEIDGETELRQASRAVRRAVGPRPRGLAPLARSRQGARARGQLHRRCIRARPNARRCGHRLPRTGRRRHVPPLAHPRRVTAQRGANVGFALKQHQRAWALHHGLRKVTWTFDPLVRRNAFFNIQKLARRRADYLENFYGTMNDDINGGRRERPAARSTGVCDARTSIAQRTNGAPSLDVRSARRRDGRVVGRRRTEPRRAGGDASCARRPTTSSRCATAIRRRRWHGAARFVTRSARRCTDGYRVTGFSRSGWYVLERS